MIQINKIELARIIDQTKLDPKTTEWEMIAFVQEAREYCFYSVAMMPSWIPLATKILEGSETTIVAAVSYPLGNNTESAKVVETRWCIDHGPKDIEIDMVMNIPLLKSGHYNLVEKDIYGVVKAADGHIVKVIIEVPLLTRDEIVIASLIAENAGASFIKTSTGYKNLSGWRPTTIEDVQIIRRSMNDRLKVKVAGGINNTTTALAMIEAGASRIGTSSGIPILQGL